MTFNIQDMLAKAQEMQSKLADTQEHLAGIETDVEVGGGMVRVSINGKQQVRKITIEKSVVNPADVEMLEDLLVAAVNKAIEQSMAMAQDELKKATSGVIPNIPGLDLSNFGM
jgi:DNA-binding YbaB/EbfC family protein